jgi:hypothetical protein
LVQRTRARKDGGACKKPGPKRKWTKLFEKEVRKEACSTYAFKTEQQLAGIYRCSKAHIHRALTGRAAVASTAATTTATAAATGSTTTQAAPAPIPTAAHAVAPAKQPRASTNHTGLHPPRSALPAAAAAVE